MFWRMERGQNATREILVYMSAKRIGGVSQEIGMPLLESTQFYSVLEFFLNEFCVPKIWLAPKIVLNSKILRHMVLAV
jgi:hypothetical protein